MDIVWVILILFVLSIVVALWAHKSQRDGVVTLGKATLSAVQEFEMLCDVTRAFSKDEADEYTEKHRKLFQQVSDAIKTIWVTKQDIKEYRFHDFIKYYSNIIALQQENNTINLYVSIVNQKLELLWNEQVKFEKSYHSQHKLRYHKTLNILLVDAINVLKGKGLLQKVDNPKRAEEFIRTYNAIFVPENVREHNDAFVNRALVDEIDFFDTCLKYPLDKQQREAILRLEDNALVISSAGSGKTSTMVGKVYHLVEKCKVNPENILIITYTRKAAGELSERLNLEGLSCSTFHSLAVKIISECTGKKPTICEPDIMLNCFYELLRNDKKFKESINRYALEMRSFVRLEHDYDTAEEYYADRKKYGIQCSFTDFKGNIIYTRSEEERRICEWLTVHGIRFTYEESYEYKTDDNAYRQYKPDFSIYYKDQEGNPKRLYLEHFAINDKIEVPQWFGNDYNALDQSPEAVVQRWENANRKYKDGIRWKLALHESMHTNLVYTTSAMFHNNSIWSHLELCLKNNNVPYRVLSQEELYEILVRRNRTLERSIFKLIEQFIALKKSNQISFQELIRRAKDKKDDRSIFIIDEIMEPFAQFYESKLRDNGSIDFTDAILQATRLCEENKRKISLQNMKESRIKCYEYILVDEFQDISIDRYLFLKSLRIDVTGFFTSLFCVGDDWQSIYRFSGSDMSLFYDFDKYFGYTEHCKIETTYRFYNPLIQISSNFIQRNESQVTKEIKENANGETDEYKMLLQDIEKDERQMNLLAISRSTESISQREELKANIELKRNRMDILKKRTQIHYHSYMDDSEDEKQQIENIIRSLPKKETILIIGRYNYDVCSLGYELKWQDADKQMIILTLGDRKVRFMSVHASKGLEADHVFLLNCNQGINGFPSLIEDDPILSFVLSDKDCYENAEERRVFYVAITRAKKNIHIFYDERRPSCFVEELMGKDIIKSIPCPVCGHGSIIKVKEGISARGQWLLLACSNKAANCPYHKMSSPEELEIMIEDFNNRNDLNPVQKIGISAARNIKKYREIIAQLREFAKKYGGRFQR